ncbi:MAG TPA: histidine phosphatase family protein [Candidatus Limnocylindrales bacterium]|nr:histidine phosphatase family protein [Candidatus Limnocylindrales bacterium]
MDDPPRERPLTHGTDNGPGLIPAGLDATLVLVRHGESTFIVEGRFQGQAETELSATGLAQARLTGARLASPAAPPALPVPATPPLEIVHSPLARTATTAAEIASAMAGQDSFEARVPVRPDPGFAEIGQGEWEGLHRDEIEARWGDVLATWRQRPLEAWAPGGEALPDVQARLRPGLERTLAALASEDGRRERIPDGRPHVAGYRTGPGDGPWSVVVGHDGVFKVLLLTLFDLPLERFWMWSFDLAGISVIEIRGGRPLVRAMNLVEHLAPVLDEEARAETDERRRAGAL